MVWYAIFVSRRTQGEPLVAKYAHGRVPLFLFSGTDGTTVSMSRRFWRERPCCAFVVLFTAIATRLVWEIANNFSTNTQINADVCKSHAKNGHDFLSIMTAYKVSFSMNRFSRSFEARLLPSPPPQDKLVSFVFRPLTNSGELLYGLRWGILGYVFAYYGHHP